MRHGHSHHGNFAAGIEPEQPLLRAGQLIAGHRVVELLGRGGSGQVYRTDVDEICSQPGTAAIKVMHPGVSSTSAGEALFRRECELSSTVRHRNLVHVTAWGREAPTSPATPDSLLWMSMDFFAGGSAQHLVQAAQGRLEIPVALAIAAQTATGLDYLHDQDLIHRDVKPSNILIDYTRGLRAAMTDLGLARFIDEARPVARHGRIEGSIPYASPELLTAQRMTPSSDVYGLACTLVELFTGTPPFPRSTIFDTAQAHLSEPPPSLHTRRPSLPAAIDEAIATGMSKNPRARQQTCAALVAECAALFGLQRDRDA